MSFLNSIVNLVNQTNQEENRERSLVANFDGLSFNNLEKGNQIFSKFISDAPKWRLVIKGLNFEAKCKSSNCAVFKKMVWVQKGMGKFNVLDIVFNGTKCPICRKKTEDATNIGLWDCTWIVDGNQITPKKRKVHRENIAPDLGITTFKHSEAQWISLTITTSSSK